MESSPHSSIQPSADFCFGRDQLCNEVVRSAFRSRSVLLFGGRQAGKTTALLRIARDLGTAIANVAFLGDLDLAVYVNLLRLPDEAVPAHFFRQLARLARDACQRQIAGYVLPNLPSESRAHEPSIEEFVDDLKAIFAAAGEVQVRLIFLLDESKRVLGDRFPRGFQDNLFTLLYSDDFGIGDQVALVFAGAQDLYRFCEDDTSPIGSRAAFHFVDSLPSESIMPLLLAAGIPETTTNFAILVDQVFDQTGGHAGLTARLAEALATRAPTVEELAAAVVEVRQRHNQLMRLWTSALSTEARIIQPLLQLYGRLSFHDIARALREKELDPIRSDRVVEELCFTGISRKESDHLVRANALYWAYFSTFAVDEKASEEELDVWRLIEQVEVSYRAMVLRKYEIQWPSRAIDQIEKTLGAEAWEKVKRFQESAGKSYPYSPGRPDRDIMECLYLGQLSSLIISNQAWVLFKHLFRDKRHFQDLIAAIMPVRNDQAHFVKVPTKELSRCRVACDDLLVIWDREDQALT